jgi:peptidyl-prolyl isomerase D
VRYIEIHDGGVDDPELVKKYDALLTPVLLNAALCAIKVGGGSSAREAISLTTRALGLRLANADKAKALYRRALAQAIVNEDGLAEEDLLEAATLVPDDAAVKAELAKVRERVKSKRELEKKKFKKMFS